jgi:4-hydroxythreonine-4-phosphate dehydrogenase
LKTAKRESDKQRIAAKPVVGITMGDPAGIGPEIVLKSLTDGRFQEICTPIVIGDLKTLRQMVSKAALNVELESIDFESFERPGSSDSIFVVDLDNVPCDLRLGCESAEAGKAAGQFIETAVDLCQNGHIDAVVTAPINKRSFNAGGFDFPGHTEFLAYLTDTKEFRMSFFADKLRVVLHSTHVSLKDAIDLVTKESLVELIRFSNRELETLLGRRVKIAVAGLNPHASEGGMFGEEEATEIEPAVAECRKKFDIDVTGPYSPDTIFLRAFRGEFDAVISVYHDQATIAVKCLSFGKGVNVTLGLPIIRTSVDHGTAFEIAGMNRAECGSMDSAIRLGAELAAARTIQH